LNETPQLIICVQLVQAVQNVPIVEERNSAERSREGQRLERFERY
jgi:hypothetical protein